MGKVSSLGAVAVFSICTAYAECPRFEGVYYPEKCPAVSDTPAIRTVIHQIGCSQVGVQHMTYSFQSGQWGGSSVVWRPFSVSKQLLTESYADQVFRSTTYDSDTLFIVEERVIKATGTSQIVFRDYIDKDSAGNLLLGGKYYVNASACQ